MPNGYLTDFLAEVVEREDAEVNVVLGVTGALITGDMVAVRHYFAWHAEGVGRLLGLSQEDRELDAAYARHTVRPEDGIASYPVLCIRDADYQLGQVHTHLPFLLVNAEHVTAVSAGATKIPNH